jgi:hypothetical protein
MAQVVMCKVCGRPFAVTGHDAGRPAAERVSFADHRECALSMLATLRPREPLDDAAGDARAVAKKGPQE